MTRSSGLPASYELSRSVTPGICDSLRLDLLRILFELRQVRALQEELQLRRRARALNQRGLLHADRQLPDTCCSFSRAISHQLVLRFARAASDRHQLDQNRAAVHLPALVRAERRQQVSDAGKRLQIGFELLHTASETLRAKSREAASQ